MTRLGSTLAYLASLVAFFCLISVVTAAPTPRKPSKSSGITLRQLQTAFAGHCPTKTQGDVISCRDALPYINAAMKKYKLTTKGQQAAYVANMAYEGGYLKYNHNLVNPSQGTRSIMPAVSLRIFVDANKSVQKFWKGYPKGVDNNKIVDVLIKKKVDFEPGAWWTRYGPGCAVVAKSLNGTVDSFIAWEKACINGGAETIPARAAIFKTVYAALSKKNKGRK